MADISREIQELLDAVYGEEVRGSFISMAEKVNKESAAAKEAAVNMAEMAADAVLNANTAAERAEAAVSNAQKTAGDIQAAAERGDFSATVSVEGIVTSEAGTQASVENIGTEKDARFLFTIPKGDKGDKGEDGTSINIKDRLDSEQDLPADGSKGDAYIVQGDVYVWDGLQWNNIGKIQGPKGDPATIRIGEVTSGENASVENVGTERDAVLNFIIPKGEDGRSVGLGEPEISVDTGIGEPYAEVTLSGPDEAKVIRFEFHNLKGEPGAEGAIDETAAVTFTKAGERENIRSGETLSVILGKLEKIISEMKEVAFSGAYADLAGAPKNVGDLTNDAKYVTADILESTTDSLKSDFVSKAGDTVTGTLKVQTLVIGTAPSDEVGSMWIE